MSHTPGPWRVGDEGPAILTIEIVNPAPGVTDTVLAEIENTHVVDRENFQLMSAAPELYAVCKRVRQDMGVEDTDYYDDLVAAIAKAEGRTT